VTEVLNRLEKTLQKQVADEDLRVISNLVYTEEDIVTIESEFKNLILGYSLNSSANENKAFRKFHRISVGEISVMLRALPCMARHSPLQR